MTKPVVVQHSFGEVGAGGPIGALRRLTSSRLADAYEFVPLHQSSAAGGINFRLLKEWAVELRRVRPDIVHVRGLGNEGFHGVLAARLAGCRRVLVSVHGTQRDLTGPVTLRRRIVVEVLEPLTLMLASHVTTVCRFAMERPFVQRHRRKLVGPLVNGVSFAGTEPAERAPVRAEVGAGDDDLVLISVGRLTQEKGHRDLAEALSQLPRAVAGRLVLVVVGDGPDATEIEDAYRGVTGLRVVMLGQRLDVPRLLSGADVFVFPTWHENLSNALIEAMAAGLPVVATRVGGNTEVVEGGGGILVEAHAPAELSTSIVRVAEDASLRAELARAAKDNALSNYSLDAMVESADAIYLEMLGSKR